mmetsp:Transcript_104370/g.332032  ORF Transcript_104370/g.332032 Transcript_104370/m.332032 type:complete len:349 (-) Transcript_104370:753-1799(-)
MTSASAQETAGLRHHSCRSCIRANGGLPPRLNPSQTLGTRVLLDPFDLCLQLADPCKGVLAGRPLFAQPLLHLKAPDLLVEVSDRQLLVHDLRRHLLQLLHQRGHARPQLHVGLRRLHLARKVSDPGLCIRDAPEAILDVHGESLRGMTTVGDVDLVRLAVVRHLQPPHDVTNLLGCLLVGLQALVEQLDALGLLYPALMDLGDVRLNLLQAALRVHALYAVAEGPVVVLLGLDARAQGLQALLLCLDLDVKLMALLLEHLDLLAGIGEPALERHKRGTVACHLNGVAALHVAGWFHRANGEVLGAEALHLGEPLVEVHKALAGVLREGETLLHKALQTQHALVVPFE